MTYGALIIAALALAVAVTCAVYMQFASTRPPRSIVISSIAATILSLLAISFALVY